VASAVVRFGDFAFDRAQVALDRAGKPVRLTSGEAALMEALAETPGAVLTRDDLSDRAGVAARTLDVRINRLRRKIELDPRNPRYLVTVRGAGYVLRAV
jgi:two-component system phosphate regulon response regulator OmpR